MAHDLLASAARVRTRLPVWQPLAALVLMALGFLLVVQLRTGRELVAEQPEVPTRNVYALASLLREEREARRALERQVAALRQQLERYERAQAQGRSLAASLTHEVEQLRMALGLVAMEGPGVVVVLRDAPVQPAGAAPVVVTYQDLVGVVNELWAAGAEAVAVNGQRVTAMTGFSQVGGTVVVNLRRLTAPYRITALGDPQTLEEALTIRGGLVEGLRGLGLAVQISRHPSLQVPPYTGTIQFERARPVR